MFSSILKNNYFSLISLTSIVTSLFFDGSVIGFSLILLFLLVSFLSKSLNSILLTGILLHAFIFYLLGDVYSSNTSAGLWLQLFASWISAIIFVSRLAFLNPKIFVFLTAIFSQFVEAGASLEDRFVLAFIALVIDASWYVIVATALSGTPMLDKLRSKGHLVDQLVGIILLIFALMIITSHIL